MQGHALGVDLGTSNTVAVLRWPDGRTRPLLFDGQPLLPSGVLLDEAGQLHVGRDAQRLAQADPARYEPNPKRRIDDPTVLLGDREVHTVDTLAAILAAVAHAAVEAVGYLPPAALTYPAAWGGRRRELLATAVTRAGWPPVNGEGGTRLVPEPVAAARYFAEALRRPIPVGAAIAVFDFGGGTLDVAVVRNEGPDATGRSRFAVIGTGGVAELGGLDLDATLVDHLGRVIAGADPKTWDRLARPSSATQLRDRSRFWEDVRGAKEMLSRAAVAPIAVPGVDQHVHLTREELERLTTPLLRRGVHATAAVIADAGLRPDQLAGLFLVGGSSRVPLVSRLLHAELGVAPTVLEQPELPVAEGALAEIAAPPVAAPVPASVSPAAAPVTSGPPHPPGGRAAAVPARLPGRRLWWVAGAAAVVVVALVVAGALWFVNRGGAEKVDFQTFVDVGKPIPAGEDRPLYAWSQIAGDRAFFAYQKDDEHLDVIGADIATGKALWHNTSTNSADQWRPIRAVPGYVLVRSEVYDSTKPSELYVIDAKSGDTVWSQPVMRDDGVMLLGDRLVLVDRKNAKVVGFELRTGATKWTLDSPKDQYKYATTLVYRVTTTEDLDQPADDGGDDERLVQIGADRSLRVIDAEDGKVLKSRPNVADPDSATKAFAHNGRFVVTDDAEGTRVYTYDLDSLGEPRTVYSAPDTQRRVEDIAPCGADRACLLENTGNNDETTELVSIDLDKGGQKWRKPAAKPSENPLVPVGDYVLVRRSSPDSSILFDAAGKPTMSRDAVGVRVTGRSVLFFGSSLTNTSVTDTSMAGLTAGDTQAVELGPLKAVRPASCSWNTELIACAGESDFVIRRFAKA